MILSSKPDWATTFQQKSERWLFSFYFRLIGINIGIIVIFTIYSNKYFLDKNAKSGETYKKSVPWHSLYKHSLYVTKFIRTFFIRDRVYTGQSLYRTNFIRGQNLYEDKVYTVQSLYGKKFIPWQSLYKLFSYCTWIKGYKVNVKNMYIIQSNHIRVCNCYCYCSLIIPWIYDQG